MNKGIAILVVFFAVVSCKNNSSNSANSSAVSSDPCSDMESYNQGLNEGKTQRGILTDCETYYPSPGWAKNYDCWCQGFTEGMR